MHIDVYIHISIYTSICRSVCTQTITPVLKYNLPDTPESIFQEWHDFLILTLLARSLGNDLSGFNTFPDDFSTTKLVTGPPLTC